ncbi:bile acid:sodium symporter family protein [Nonomuraea sp. bgisy101]|uniref:bile acid:sodium symporter family protein n=1 Tax=Nonomuraea sp. bgisy101 TaxID=3413784 RepID=UPI003D7050FB
MSAQVLTTLLPIAVVMFGLGLTLTPRDFLRVVEAPRAVAVALAVQVLVLPALCFALVVAFDLAPALAVGMMLLAASPGGTVANLFSHLAGGNVALNVTLTAINSVLAVVTMPLVVNLAVGHFLGGHPSLGLQPGETLQVFAFVLVPVAIGMALRRRAPGFAELMKRPVKVASAVLLVVFVVVALAANHRMLLGHFVTVGPVALLLSVAGLALGYWAPRLARIGHAEAVASAFEIGLHNVTIALAVAVTLLPDPDIVIPAAIYGVVMYVPALVCYRLLARRGGGSGGRRAGPLAVNARRALRRASVGVRRDPPGGSSASSPACGSARRSAWRPRR